MLATPRPLGEPLSAPLRLPLPASPACRRVSPPSGVCRGSEAGRGAGSSDAGSRPRRAGAGAGPSLPRLPGPRARPGPRTPSQRGAEPRGPRRPGLLSATRKACPLGRHDRRLPSPPGVPELPPTSPRPRGASERLASPGAAHAGRRAEAAATSRELGHLVSVAAEGHDPDGHGVSAKRRLWVTKPSSACPPAGTSARLSPPGVASGTLQTRVSLAVQGPLRRSGGNRLSSCFSLTTFTAFHHSAARSGSAVPKETATRNGE